MKLQDQKRTIFSCEFKIFLSCLPWHTDQWPTQLLLTIHRINWILLLKSLSLLFILCSTIKFSFIYNSIKNETNKLNININFNVSINISTLKPWIQIKPNIKIKVTSKPMKVYSKILVKYAFTLTIIWPNDWCIEVLWFFINKVYETIFMFMINRFLFFVWNLIGLKTTSY